MSDAADRNQIMDELLSAAPSAARIEFSRKLGPAFAAVGQHLWVTGNMVGDNRVRGVSPFGFGSDATVGVGVLAEIAAELTSGSAILLDADGSYGSMALTRQLVEVEYLLWAFANDKDEAESWLRSTNDERRKRWQPGHLRQRSEGRFRSRDYAQHCEIGGHPTPSARLLLPNHAVRREPEFCWLELAVHGRSAWGYLTGAIERLDDAAWHVDHLASMQQVTSLIRASEEWGLRDPLSDMSFDLVANSVQGQVNECESATTHSTSDNHVK